MRAAIRKVISLDFGPFGGSAANDRIAPPSTKLHGTALLVTADKLSLHWAPRWLRQTGLDVEAVSSAAAARDSIAAQAPAMVIIDASLRDDGNAPFIVDLRQLLGTAVPVIALCNSDADVSLAVDARVTDIARQPLEWEVISRRVVKAVSAQATLEQLHIANSRLLEMQSSVSAANRARAKKVGMDRVTGLPDLSKFRSLLHKVTTVDSSANNKLCLLVIGIDRFRQVNEAVGFQNGNDLLRQFADRLRGCLRDRDVIGDAGAGSITAIAGRVGGARFGMLVSNGDKQQIRRIRQSVMNRLREPFEVAGQSVFLTASIGAAVYPNSSSKADELLHHAENAMFDAQDFGSGFEFYTGLGDTGSQQALTMDRMLRDAVRNDELNLAYQPIVDARSNAVVAAEALLRWQHPVEGDISPAVFVPVAESTGAMAEIGDFVIRTACRQLGEWLKTGSRPIRMAINLSLCQLMRGDVVATIKTALDDNGVAPELLELELSERGVLNRNPAVIAQVHRLKKLGVRISIDDFGTGQAAISYLKDLPIDVIKIDRCYVSGADRNQRDAAIAAGMVALADRLDAVVVTEGVESREQLELARDWGAAEYQGFYFSQAVPADDFEHLYLSKPGI